MLGLIQAVLHHARVRSAARERAAKVDAEATLGAPGIGSGRHSSSPGKRVRSFLRLSRDGSTDRPSRASHAVGHFVEGPSLALPDPEPSKKPVKSGRNCCFARERVLKTVANTGM
jgi:hypothetical protein